MLGLGLAALLLWFASRVRWANSEFTSPLRGTVRLSASGAQVHPELSAVAVLLVAIVAAVVASTGWLRRLVGVLTAAVAVWLLSLGLRWFVGPPPAWPADAPRPPTEAVAGAVTTSGAGAALVAVSGALAGVAAVVMIGWSRGLPAMGRRYSARATVAREDDWWQVLDRGDDPTTGGRGTDPGPRL